MILVDDRALLDGFRRGDPKSLLQVYRHYVVDVTRFLTRGFTFSSKGKPCSFRGFGGGYEVEAAVQEVFRRAFEERARLAYDGLNPYRPYLLRIARNAVLNDLKAKNPILFKFRAGRPVTIEPAEEERPEEIPESSANPEEIAEAKEVAALVQSFKTSLSERETGVFESRFEKGLAAEAAGATLGLSRSQVRTTEQKLRQAFLRHMQAAGYLDEYQGRAKAQKVAGVFAAVLCLGGIPL